MRQLILGLAGLMALLIFFSQAQSQGGASSDAQGGGRQAEIAARGATVMPFDLEKTLHRFQKTSSGGVQTVWTKDPADDDQADLIRTHLRELAAAFGRGDFSGPRAIHGGDMPGLAQLEKAGESLSVHYAEQSDGATLAFTGKTPETIAAIHAFFDAQTSDHGRHAVGGDDAHGHGQPVPGQDHSGHGAHGS